MLTEEDGLLGCNFLTKDIHTLAEERIAQGSGALDSDRLRRNLLSSQPMCFNLFGPLALDTQLATRLVRSLPDAPQDIQVTEIVFEYAPEPSSHLDDGTAFDVFVSYERPGGRRGFVGIETKLTEPFTQEEHRFREGYNRWREFPDWWWRNDATVHFPAKKTNQLWRNHLLAFSMLHQESPAYSEGFCAVVYPEDDLTCADAMSDYRSYLLPEARPTLLDWPLAGLLEQWDKQLVSADEREWMSAFHLRYLDMQPSQAAWENHLATH